MQTKPRITIAICTYNRAVYLKDTLDGLAAQDAPKDAFEIVVVNNNSKDGTRTVCEIFEISRQNINFRMVDEARQGLAYARNRAVSAANSQIILFIDDDVYLPENFVSATLQYLAEHPSALCAGGRIWVCFDDEEQTTQPNWIPDELMPMFGLHNLGDEKKLYPAGNFPRGGNMLIHTSVFDAFGRFDTRLGRTGKKLLGSEEKAFFERIRKNGVALHYWPGMELTHRIGAERMTDTYLKNQSVGIGESEGMRIQDDAGKIIKKFAGEMVKLSGSLILAVFYLMKNQPKAARFLIKFRFWVLNGFFQGAFRKSSGGR